MQFLTSHPTRWLRTHRFSKPTFRPSGATKHWKKHSVARLFYLFARLDLPSCSFLFSDLLSSAFLFSDSYHLRSSMCPYCRKFDCYLLFAVNILVRTLWTDQSVFRRLEGVLAVRADQQFRKAKETWTRQWHNKTSQKNWSPWLILRH